MNSWLPWASLAVHFAMSMFIIGYIIRRSRRCVACGQRLHECSWHQNLNQSPLPEARVVSDFDAAFDRFERNTKKYLDEFKEHLR